MAADIRVKVDPVQLEQAAGQFENKCTECTNLVKQITNLVNTLRSNWRGRAADEYCKKLNELAKEIEDIKKIIMEHVNDLRAAKKVFDQVEDTTTVDAMNLNADVLSY